MSLDLRITLFLARRSLLESPFPTALLIVSIAIGVAFQVPSTANLNGFRAELLSQSVDSGSGDVRVRPTRVPYIYDTSDLIKKLSRHAYVTEDACERADVLLARFGLAAPGDAPAHVLSLGEAQRVAGARALVIRPRVVLADEPTGSLDSASTTAVLDALTEVCAAGSALLVVTHDRQVAARCGRQLVMHDGSLAPSPELTGAVQ